MSTIGVNKISVMFTVVSKVWVETADIVLADTNSSLTFTGLTEDEQGCKLLNDVSGVFNRNQ